MQTEKGIKKLSLLLLCGVLSLSGNAQTQNLRDTSTAKPQLSPIALGAFSLSLNVKDLSVSRSFYEKLGFTVFGGSMQQRYLIMKNGNALIGLFQGMFEGNILTFNPGWDEQARNMDNYEDIRGIQQKLKARGLELITEADEKTKGPSSLMLKDPDGNLILLDQHR